ncbi:glycosyl transferase [Eubacterium sp. An11]|uniref:beta 1-4 rhamnosyltransferase Cps2T n=1 Tax=Eubacterium sp. An11 TaxID=1965542 RepID=UPI000B39AE63|nr:DUF1972 domain-containing protein [Eubacterium sp. An11]OUQ68484.1 glycosyl transferase [Eubacterium sp. An11]
MTSNQKQHVFIVGSKGIPAAYGGFETFVEKLTEYRKQENIQYHVAVLSDHTEEYEHNGAHCFCIKVPNVGSAKAIYYDCAALNYCLKYCKKHPEISKPIFYVLACRIGPFISHFKRQIRALGGKLYVNPDGHEWKRAKWNKAIRKYWKYSESKMVKHADLLICDSVNIEKYIKEEYARYNPKTTFIAYGSETSRSALKDDDKKWASWCKEHHVKPKEYYLVVGRFVPENNYETMIREFMKAKTEKSFVLVTNVTDKFRDELKERTHFQNDSRINFVGTVYDQELLKKIRENAYGYFHGHEVGGTNPSLLEALGSTDLNLLLGVGFNREVAGDAALYWSKKAGSLAKMIEKADEMTDEEILSYGKKAKRRIQNAYTWDIIVDKYEKIFIKNR